MGIQIKGFEKLGTVHGNFSPNVVNFNAGLTKLVDDWAKTYSTIYANKNGKQSALSLIKVTPLAKLKTVKGQSNVQRARIEITVRPDTLNNYPIEQLRVTTNWNILSVSKKAKHTTRKLTGKTAFTTSDLRVMTVTKVKIRKASSMQVVIVPPKNRSHFLSVAKASKTKGFYYDKKSRVDANPKTKSGVYIRANVPYKRYPLVQLQNIPVAYLFNSSRTTTALKLDSRFAELSRMLK